MKLAFVKQPWLPVWSWESTRFTTSMLDTFFYKSTNLSLLLHFGGDIWVVEDGPTFASRYAWEGADLEALTEVYRRTPVVAWNDVPWGEYDIVFTQDPIAPRHIIEAHPRALWCYIIPEHSRSGQYGGLYGYDLLWDYTLESPDRLTRLPQALSLPFMVNADALRGLVKPTNEAAVFVPSRMVRPHGDMYPPLFGREEVAGLPMRHDRIWNLGRTWRAILDGEVETTREHLANVGSCKYLLNVRDADIGQPILEAAALGLVVVSTPEKYATICHPDCWVADLDEAICTIERLERVPGTREHILQHQDEVLREQFWDRPLSLLREALKMKREVT
jgi:hypothetical protein